MIFVHVKKVQAGQVGENIVYNAFDHIPVKVNFHDVWTELERICVDGRDVSTEDRQHGQVGEWPQILCGDRQQFRVSECQRDQVGEERHNALRDKSQCLIHN